MQSFPKPEGLITGKEYDVLINQSCGKVFSPQALFLLGASFSSQIKKKRKKKAENKKKKRCLDLIPVSTHLPGKAYDGYANAPG